MKPDTNFQVYPSTAKREKRLESILPGLVLDIIKHFTTFIVRIPIFPEVPWHHASPGRFKVKLTKIAEQMCNGL